MSQTIQRRATGLAGGALVLFVFTLFPLDAEDKDDVVDYATKCFARLNLDVNELKDSYSCNTVGGYQLFTTINGVIQDIHIYGKDNPGHANAFPATCDRPAWLILGTDTRCYGNSYLQVFNNFTNKDVKAALLCRHKRDWSDGDKDFNDIAMIFHNKKNGQTCWFQTTDGGSSLDGTKVPAPHKGDAARAFWLKPSDTARVGCIDCHDNGPWMNSRWMNDNLRRLKGKGTIDDPLQPNEFNEGNPLSDRLGPY